MQKVLDILERHVQWIVLGLGGLYLLYMVWAYVITPPVTVEVGGQAVTPGKVDDRVYNEKASQLDDRMRRQTAVRIPDPEDPLQAFMTALTRSGTAATGPMPAVVFSPVTGKIETPSAPGAVAGAPPVPGVPSGPGRTPAVEQMQSLPKPPAAVDVLTRRGRGTVLVPDPSGTPDPNNPGLGPVASLDKDWVTVRFTVKPADLAKAFADVKVPQIFSRTSFLRIDLIRETRLSSGDWGEQTVVAPLKISRLPPFPAAGDRIAMSNYNDWARMNQLEVVQPPFYSISKGDRWGVPGMEEKENAGQTQGLVFDPQQYLDPKSDLSQLTPEQRNEVMAARRKAAAEQQRLRREQGRQQRPAGGVPGDTGGEFGPSGGGRGGGRGPGSSGPVVIPQTIAPIMQQPMRDMGPIGGPFPGSGEFGAFDPALQQQQQFQNVNLSQEFPIPNGEFDPRDAALKDITGWVHDDSVEPGKVYRYKIRYRIKNPVFQTVNVTKNPADATTFDLASADSEWTDEVSIPSLTSFFLSANFDAESVRSVKFEVFKFEAGTLHAQTFTVQPGDAIGRSEKGVEFGTGWTLVDLRRDFRGSGSFAVITDSTGRIVQRRFGQDQSDAEFQKLRRQMTEQAAARGG